MNWWTRVIAAFAQDARDADVTANELVFPTATPDETVSEDVALLSKPAEETQCRFCNIVGRAFCIFLSFAVQKDHCEVTMTDAPMPASVYFRAAVAFLFFPISISAVALLIVILLVKPDSFKNSA